ncbi:MAG TPA: hypothetical protein VFQ60_03495 [Patescibacteria group bacterium]|nr:hypothetical protein [Patescibacteria group bacterium]
MEAEIPIVDPYRGMGKILPLIPPKLRFSWLFASITWVGKVTVDYEAQLSCFELKQWFDVVHQVSSLDGSRKLAWSRWGTVPCKGIQTRRYGYVRMKRAMLIPWVRRRILIAGLLPATDLEAVFFSRKFPDEQRTRIILPTGSFFDFYNDQRGYALLLGNERQRGLHFPSCSSYGLDRIKRIREDVDFLVRER